MLNFLGVDKTNKKSKGDPTIKTDTDPLINSDKNHHWRIVRLMFNSSLFSAGLLGIQSEDAIALCYEVLVKLAVR